MKIQIKTMWGSVLFEHTTKDNSVKKTVVKAVESGATLIGANLRGADLIRIISQRTIVPEEGSFIAWKKGANQHLIKIEVPADAKRHSSLTGRKCRCEFAKVLDIRNSKGYKVKECCSQHSSDFTYRIGEIIKPDNYDPDPLEECSHGIHFFISKQEAKDW